jgi:tetratricopeptide (TPR) repeat protein
MFAAWLADTSVDWLYDIPGPTGMAIVAAGLLVVAAGQAKWRHARSRWRQAVFVLGLGILALLAASVGRQYVASRYAQAGARQAARSPQRAIGTLRQAARLDPYSLGTLYSLADAYARLDDYPRARAVLLLANRREPHNYVPPALLGDLATRRGDHRLAAAEYGRALALNPRDPTLRQARRAALAGAR